VFPVSTLSFPHISKSQTLADRLLAQEPIEDNPFFRRLQGGQMDQATFVAGQRQFYHAVRFFSQAMAALMARLPDSKSRQVLMHNLAEEHGWNEEGDGFEAGMAHDCTFLAFLSSLGVEPAPAGPAVRAFNLALYGACASEPPALALACLGMIEYAFAEISALIGNAVVERGWVAQSALVHYTLHAAIDKRHAAEFFGTLEGASEREVEDGVALGWYIFGQLYANLL
jgi:pyrroloquinoline-quinone synthase